jgi:hypothetical protein
MMLQGHSICSNHTVIAHSGLCQGCPIGLLVNPGHVLPGTQHAQHDGGLSHIQVMFSALHSSAWQIVEGRCRCR